MHKTNYQLASAYLETNPKVLLLNHFSYFIHTMIEGQPTELLKLLVKVSLVYQAHLCTLLIPLPPPHYKLPND